MSVPDDLLLMGRIGRPHGVRGEMKVIPDTDDPSRFELLERLFVGDSPETARERRVEGVRFQYPKGRTVVLLALEAVDDLDAASALRGNNLYASAPDLPPLEEGEAYLHDLIGLVAYFVDESGEATGDPIGTVHDLLDGAQLLFAIRREGQPDALVPDVEAIVAGVDLEGRRLLLHPLEGLFE
ncbi:MAG: ribosome maturation factor RimM [Bacteroidota bacterium]